MLHSFATIQRLLEGRRVLDLGCASGAYLRHFAPGSLGLDLSAKDLSICRRQGLNVRAANLNLPLEIDDASFDAVFCSNVLEHVESPLRLLREARRVLRHPGGVLALALPVEGALSDLVGRNRYYENHGGHLYSFTPRNVRRLLNQAGFAPSRTLLEPWPAEKLRRWGLLPAAAIALEYLPRPIGLRLADNYWTVAHTLEAPAAAPAPPAPAVAVPTRS